MGPGEKLVEGGYDVILPFNSACSGFADPNGLDICGVLDEVSIETETSSLYSFRIISLMSCICISMHIRSVRIKAKPSN